MTTRILVPLDGSPLSEQALPGVAKFASRLGTCSVELLYVIDPSTVADVMPGTVVPPGYLKRAEDWAREYLVEQAKSLASSATDVSEVVSVGPPARAILDRLRSGSFDYLFMATHGRSGLARAVIGSVTDRVMREATIPVIVIHPQPVTLAAEPWPGDEAATRELIRLFNRGDLLSVRAMDLLTRRGATAVPELVEALSSHRSSETRQYAARALGLIASPAALPALVTSLSDDTWEVRWEAEEALARFGKPGVEAVMEALLHVPPDARFRLAVLHVLERAPMDLWETLKPVVHALRGRESELSAPLEASKAMRKLKRDPDLTPVS